jgi:hypothetical protein
MGALRKKLGRLEVGIGGTDLLQHLIKKCSDKNIALVQSLYSDYNK